MVNRILLFFFIIFNITLLAEDRNLVYLATYPRSGNHWLRYLIEEATGVVTTSCYCDQDHPKHDPVPFHRGGYAPINGYEGNRQYPEAFEFLVMKTHYPSYDAYEWDLLEFKKSIRVVRHPIDSFYSLYMYRRPADQYGNRIPDDNLKWYIYMWEKFQSYWDAQQNVVTVRYEDLLNNTEKVLYKMLLEIGFDVTSEDVQRAAERYPAFGCPLKHSKCFSDDQIDLIDKELQCLMNKFGYTIDTIGSSHE